MDVDKAGQVSCSSATGLGKLGLVETSAVSMPLNWPMLMLQEVKLKVTIEE